MSWLNNRKISFKIGMIVVLLIAVATGAVVFAAMRMKGIDDSYRDLVGRIDNSAILAARATSRLVVYTSSAYKLLSETTEEGNRKTLERAFQSRDMYMSLMGQVGTNMPEKAALVDPVVAQMKKAFDTCEASVRAGAAANSVDDNAKAAIKLRAECEPVIDAGLSAQAKFIEEVVAYAAKVSADLTVSTWSTIYTTFAVLGVGLLIGLGAALLVGVKGLAQPIARLKTVMEAFANNDLKADVPGTGRRDELGDMARTVKVFKTNGLEVERLKVEQQETEQRGIAQRKADMQRLANDFESAVGEIIQTVSSAATELEASANTLTATASRTEELSTVVASAAEESSANVQSVASASEEMSSSVSEIGRQVQDSARMAGDAVSQAEKTNARVVQLSQAANKIGDVVDLINTIAGQTNLLALNATIEAARAGEAGRGFAVVASEVKSLAEQTAKATGEIAEQIKGIQTATADSVEAIKEISLTIGRISEISSVIAAAVEEQGSATQEISRNVQQAAQGTSQVASNIVDVQRGSSETGSASAQVLSSAQSLSADSNKLRTEVGNFLATVRAA